MEHRFHYFITFYCDGMWTGNTGIKQIQLGGFATDSDAYGIYECTINDNQTDSRYDFGASIYKFSFYHILL